MKSWKFWVGVGSIATCAGLGLVAGAAAGPALSGSGESVSCPGDMVVGQGLIRESAMDKSPERSVEEVAKEWRGRKLDQTLDGRQVTDHKFTPNDDGSMQILLLDKNGTTIASGHTVSIKGKWIIESEIECS
ncbi:hypothetical protein [Janibacter sp. HTCC2649]|uniref:hypothetical protein n=1 Tax=Janibacter sp. HTCC2649 TaxID=313589 RepID=UPI0011D1D44E|nr:hypothetical protein [Janibacter sp. HTCC2649]